MLNTHLPRGLSGDEEVFLRHWMYDEAHYQDGTGPAKRLQVRYGVPPADLATLIAAAIPDPADQAAAGDGPPPAEAPRWPWTVESLRQRLVEARTILKSRGSAETPIRRRTDK